MTKSTPHLKYPHLLCPVVPSVVLCHRSTFKSWVVEAVVVVVAVGAFIMRVGDSGWCQWSWSEDGARGWMGLKLWWSQFALHSAWHGSIECGGWMTTTSGPDVHRRTYLPCTTLMDVLNFWRLKSPNGEICTVFTTLENCQPISTAENLPSSRKIFLST